MAGDGAVMEALMTLPEVRAVLGSLCGVSNLLNYLGRADTLCPSLFDSLVPRKVMLIRIGVGISRLYS